MGHLFLSAAAGRFRRRWVCVLPQPSLFFHILPQAKGICTVIFVHLFYSAK